MPTSNQDISKENIELEINKTFERVKKIKNPTIVDIINTLNSDLFKNKEYRMIDFSYESLCKCLLLKKLKGIRFQIDLIRYLKTHKRERKKLGLTRTPDQTTLSYFINHILDDETKEIIEFVANKIEEISKEFKIILDINALNPEKPKKINKLRNQFLIKSEKTIEISRIIKKKLSPFININLNHNAIYRKNEFIDLMIHMGTTRDFAENGCATLRILRRCIGPDADTLFYHLESYSDVKEIEQMFTVLSEIVWDMARKNKLFNKKVDVAIDFTGWHFYGDKNTPMITMMKFDKGTTKYYKFATINIVESGKRFTLLALPVGPFDDKSDILKKLLSYALERIKIKRVYIDRGFCDAESIKVFNRFHLKFLMPCTEYYTVKKVLEIMPAPAVVENFEMKDVTFNLIVVEEEDKNGKMVKRAFATNENFDENDVNLAERLFYLYGKRWGIETSYKVKKHSYLSKTVSKNYLVRLFYFLFSVLLYNLWILADILIWLVLFGRVNKKHFVTSKFFGTTLYTTGSDSEE